MEEFKSFIRGYDVGANISLLNVIYHKPKKDPKTGKYGKDSVDIIFRDMDTNQKKVQHISEPEIIYYMTNEGVPVSYNRLFIEETDVYPVVCKYSELKLDIAKRTGNLDYFYDNIRNGNSRANDKLLTLPSVFSADINIEDFYRFRFDLTYKNELFNPTKLYFDIETDIIDIKGDFVKDGEAPVNAVTIVDGTGYNVYTLLLENKTNPLIEEFKEDIESLPAQIKEFVRETVGGWKNECRLGIDKLKFKLAFYDEEINLIADLFRIINYISPDFAVAWNIKFDLPYLIDRINVLGYDHTSIICDKEFNVKEAYYYIDMKNDKFEQKGDYAQISTKIVYMDQLVAFASRRKGQKAIDNFKLDYIGSIIAGVRKLDYSNITTKLAELPYLNYRVFVFYNIMDTIVQMCIENKVEDIDFVYSKSIMNNTRYSKVHRQTTYLINRARKDFREMGYILGGNINTGNEKDGFAGAFVADPTLLSEKPRVKINNKPIMVCNNLDDYDYKALYPSTIDENNMAPNTQIGKILLPEQIDPKEDRFNNPYFDRSVWFIEDYTCGDRINFCERYLGLAGYMTMYNDILEYFTKTKLPRRGLMNYDIVKGLVIPCNIVDNTQKLDMCRIDNRMINMCTVKGVIPSYEDINNRISLH